MSKSNTLNISVENRDKSHAEQFVQYGAELKYLLPVYSSLSSLFFVSKFIKTFNISLIKRLFRH